MAHSPYHSREFRSPTRSTVPLLSLLRHGTGTWNDIVRGLGFRPEAVAACLEHRTPPPRGRGAASHTDVMLLSDARACAIEAKWTEPRYATVATWLTRGRNARNRETVLDGWLDVLARTAGNPLHRDDLAGAVYQMVHRAASAVLTQRSPSMAYLQFVAGDADQKRADKLRADLAHLHGLLGRPGHFPFHLVEVEARPTPEFERLRGLPKGSPETADAVQKALQAGPLFIFPQYQLISVRETDA